jgi:PIN domain nuclease of toxin-antitoxin system
MSRRTYRFLPDAKSWFRELMSRPAVRPAAFTPDIAIDSANLPGDLHRDPGDRLLIATARHLGAPIVTRDRRILAYAKAGHVWAIAC